MGESREETWNWGKDEVRNLSGKGRKEAKVWEVHQHWEPAKETDGMSFMGTQLADRQWRICGKQQVVRNTAWLSALVSQQMTPFNQIQLWGWPSPWLHVFQQQCGCHAYWQNNGCCPQSGTWIWQQAQTAGSQTRRRLPSYTRIIIFKHTTVISSPCLIWHTVANSQQRRNSVFFLLFLMTQLGPFFCCMLLILCGTTMVIYLTRRSLSR